MPDNPFHDEIFPNTQSKLSLAQTGAISFCSCYLGEELNSHLTTTFFWVAVESNKVPLLKPPFLQGKFGLKRCHKLIKSISVSLCRNNCIFLLSKLFFVYPFLRNISAWILFNFYSASLPLPLKTFSLCLTQISLVDI